MEPGHMDSWKGEKRKHIVRSSNREQTNYKTVILTVELSVAVQALSAGEVADSKRGLASPV